MNTEKFVVGIRRQLLRNKRNYFACCPNVKTNSCMEMNVLNSHRNFLNLRGKDSRFMEHKKIFPNLNE